MDPAENGRYRSLAIGTGTYLRYGACRHFFIFLWIRIQKVKKQGRIRIRNAVSIFLFDSGAPDGLHCEAEGVLAGGGRVGAQGNPRGLHPDTLRHVERTW